MNQDILRHWLFSAALILFCYIIHEEVALKGHPDWFTLLVAFLFWVIVGSGPDRK